MGILLKKVLCGLGLLLLSAGKNNGVSGSEYEVTLYTDRADKSADCNKSSLFEAIVQIVWCLTKEEYRDQNGHYADINLPALDAYDGSELHSPDSCTTGISETNRTTLHYYVGNHQCEGHGRRVESANKERQKKAAEELFPLSTLRRTGRRLNYQCCYCQACRCCAAYQGCIGHQCRRRTEETEECAITDDMQIALEILFNEKLQIFLQHMSDDNVQLYQFLEGVNVNVHTGCT